MSEFTTIASIAIIDDGFIPIKVSDVPEPDVTAVLGLLESENEGDLFEELKNRGLHQAIGRGEFDVVLDGLTDPQHEHGVAFAELSGISHSLGKMIDDRHSVRRIGQQMKESGDFSIFELAPRVSLEDVSECQIVFIDYYLDSRKGDGSLAEEVAKKVHQQDERDPKQQIVLMSSRDNPRRLRKEFRMKVGLEATYFSFMSKSDLDAPWKVQAFLRWFDRAAPYAELVNDYFASTKASICSAYRVLCELLDDLELADLAYLQSQALQQDGHPLGEYLSWLFSSHLISLVFEGDLRGHQRVLDAIEFSEPLISPTKPSLSIAELYHSALFSRNVGALGPHPRSRHGGEGRQLPLVELGDVFLHSSCPKALVILSAACDLALAPNTDRVRKDSDPVLVLRGDIASVLSADSEHSVMSLTGVKRGSEILCIDWRFDSYQSIEFGKVLTFLESGGYDISNRDRLRPLYALQLQQEVARYVTRVGEPVSPPVRVQLRAKVIESIDWESRTVVHDLDDESLVGSFYKGSSRLHLTTTVVERMRDSLLDLRGAMLSRAQDLRDAGTFEENASDIRALEAKSCAIDRHLRDVDRWVVLLRGFDLPAKGKSTKIAQSLHVAFGGDWTPPNESFVALEIAHPVD